MKTAAEYYDEAMDRADARIKMVPTIPATSQGHWTEMEREECIAAIEAAVADRDLELYKNAVKNDCDGRQMLLALAAAREEGRREERARFGGHGEPCYYCKEPCNGLAYNPFLWPIPICHEDEPGVVKFHHIGCVSKRLHDVAEAQRDAARYRWLRKSSIAPLTWGIAIRFPGGGSNIRAPKTEAEVDFWIDEEMRRFP